MADAPRTLRNDKLTADQIKLLDGAAIFDPNTLDSAILAVYRLSNGEHVAVYDYQELIRRYMADDGVSLGDEEAYLDWQEFVDYNTLRSVPYMGDRSPIIVLEVQEGEPPDSDPDDPAIFLSINDKKWLVVECAHDLAGTKQTIA